MVKRWKLPPLRRADGRRINLEEGMVERTLRVNPSLRRGRATGVVKEALEGGEPVVVHETSYFETAGRQEPASESFGRERVERPAGACDVRQSNRNRLTQVVERFFRVRNRPLLSELKRHVARQRRLEAVRGRLERELSVRLCTELSEFDPVFLSRCGREPFEAHNTMLEQLGLSSDSILEWVTTNQR